MDAVTNPPSVVADPTDDERPGGAATVQAWSCGMQCACTVVNPALDIIGVLPTPELRTAAFLALLRTEVARRSGKEHTR